jgi:hypothetical protein
MLKQFLSLFCDNRQSVLESFIASRQPKSQVEVEQLIREFERITTFNY